MKILSIRQKKSELISICLGLIFIASGTVKLFDIDFFVHQIKNFNILPTCGCSPIACTIIILEIILGFLLIINFKSFLMLLSSAALMALFISIMGIIGLDHGDITCGCFGKLIERTIKETIIEDLIILLVCLLGIYLSSRCREKGEDNVEY